MIAENLKTNVQVGTLARIFDQLGYPNPDDDDDWGPWGPVVSVLDRVGLNPQPLPPKFMTKITNRATIQSTQRGRKTSPAEQITEAIQVPTVQPMRSALLARATLDRIFGVAQLAQGGGKQQTETVRTQLNEIVDDWCGTPPKPRPWPLPWPFPLRWNTEEVVVQPIDQIMMGVHLHKASEVLRGTPLAEDFARAADRLAEAGLQRIG
jgi:hypothetical protein